ncbi:MAG: hypothetical protein ABI672_07075 [Vicinamibacteria bacterium]
MKSVAFLLAILATGSAAKPTIEFKPLRRITQLSVGQCDAEVLFSLRVADGGVEDYYCPKVVFEWEDGTRSIEESDCPPFDQAGADDHKRSWTRSRKFQGSGTFTVQAHLCHGERRIKSVKTTVIVAGWEGQSEDTRGSSGCSTGRPIESDGGDAILSTSRRTKDPCSE